MPVPVQRGAVRAAVLCIAELARRVSPWLIVGQIVPKEPERDQQLDGFRTTRAFRGSVRLGVDEVVEHRAVEVEQDRWPVSAPENVRF